MEDVSRSKEVVVVVVGSGGGAAVAEVVVDISEGEGVRVSGLMDSESSGYSVPQGKRCRNEKYRV